MNKYNEYNVEELKDLILNQKLSYEEIGRRYGVTGNGIKKKAKRLGIELPQRRVINDKENFNKGNSKYGKVTCIECGKLFIPYPSKSNLFCSHHCQCEHEYKENVTKWKDGKLTGHSKRYKISGYLRRYLFEKNDYCCEKCGCNLVNQYTGKSILQIHHKDGDASNTKEENLEVLCPNCHAMTENFGSRNKNSVRKYRKDDYKKNGY